MKPIVTLLAALSCALSSVTAVAVDFSQIASRADLDAAIAATTDAAFRQALADNAEAILAAAEQHPHVEAVIRAIESSPGTFKSINAPPESLKAAAGGDIALFDTLPMVDVKVSTP
jgi:hypothetical protein